MMVPVQGQTFVQGEVALVGAGPGDPELLTLKALRFIQQAEVVIYDRLVSTEIIALIPEQAEKIYVGKKQAEHKVPQDQINQLLVEHAKQHKKVVRLKGGDPFIFGRGSEEAQFLLAHNIACHIIPGLTAASACASYAGIPLTHRGLAQSCRFITGHVQQDGELDLPWHTMSDNSQTLVFYMGVKTLPLIKQQLIKAGRHATTPAAIIYKGTQAEQQVYKANLSSLEQVVEQYHIKPPSLIIVGDVVDVFTNEQLTNKAYLAASIQ